MGVVMYRRVTNVFEVPPDVFVNFIGRGLIVTRPHAEAAVESTVEGTFTDPEAALKIEVDFGAGLACDDEGELVVAAGDGLRLADDGTVAADVGVGLTISDNKLCVEEAVVDPAQNSEFTVLVDAALSLDAQMLKMKKTYRRFRVEKNRTGRVVNVVACDTFERTDEMVLNFGYGYGCGGPKPYRASTPARPNFYQP